MQKRLANNIFFQAALREMPRLLGQIDRTITSPTYGSCDRAFWHYRTNDISCMRYQEAALTLALLYVTNVEGNNYYGDEHILALTNAVISFACRSQHYDGSFDEWYLNEGSFVCTAFVSLALAETALVLKDKLSDREQLLAVLKKSGVWLLKHSEILVVNQLTGAMAALQAIASVTGDEVFRQAAAEKCALILSLQQSEGWWSEYGGPDAGYLSLAIDYLSRYAARVKNYEVELAIEGAAAFLTHLIHPDGTAGGEYLARNTEYLIPSGFIRASQYSSSAHALARQVNKFLQEDKGITPRALDDRYVSYILYNWLEAGILWAEMGGNITSGISTSPADDIFFPLSGLFVRRTALYQLFVNLKKGGSLRLYTKNAALFDSGISVSIGNKVYAANIVNPDALVGCNETTNTLHCQGTLVRISPPLLTTGRAIVLKVLQYSIGRVPVLQRLLKRLLRVMSVVRPGTASNFEYTRTISLAGNKIIITDTVNTAVSRDCIVVGEPSSYALVPSSRYATVNPSFTRLQPQTESCKTNNGTTCLRRVFTS